MKEDIVETYKKAVDYFNGIGLAANYYVIKNCDAYSSSTNLKVDIPTLEICLDQKQQSKYHNYAVVQSFYPEYPNLLMVYAIKRDENGNAVSDMPIYNVEVDRNFSLKVLFHIYSAFNNLDPKGKNKSLLLQSYNAHLTLGDLALATIYSLRLLNFRKYGQLAQIAVDYHNGFIKFIAKVLTLFKKIIPDLHYLPRTNEMSKLSFPVMQRDGSTFYISTNSTALDKGMKIALDYMRNY